MSGKEGEWSRYQLRVLDDLERLHENQKVIQANQVEQGKQIVALQVRVLIMSSIGGALLVGAIGYIVKAVS